jgi:hypothetical protein
LILFVQDDGGSYSLATTPDLDDAMRAAGSTSATPITSTSDSTKVKYEALSKTPSQCGTPKVRSTLKCKLPDTYNEDTAKEDEMLDRLGTQKHERAIGELELKRRKLENKAMEKQHQRDSKREQHKFRMMQIQVMLSQNQRNALAMMQSQNQSVLEGFGLMAELNDPTLPSGSSLLLTLYLPECYVVYCTTIVTCHTCCIS